MPLKPCQRSLRNAIVPRGTTFTIRVWSLRTVIRSESAPVSVATAVICFLSSRGWPSSLVMQDQMDVCPLSRGVILPVGATPIHPITGKPRHNRLCWLSSRETRVRQVFLQQNATEIISVVKNIESTPKQRRQLRGSDGCSGRPAKPAPRSGRLGWWTRPRLMVYACHQPERYYHAKR